MKDKYGRKINYVRISLTDRCNLRCVYCMPEEGIKLLNHSDILRYEQLLKLCQALIKIDIKIFKLTGGEPLVRKGITGFIKDLKNLDKTEEVTITTNGVLLEDLAEELIDSGIDRINVSLDTLNREKFSKITRRDDLDKVLRGIDKIINLGFKNLKINSVPIKPFDEEDIIKLAELARKMPISVRYIELMPLGKGTEFLGSTRKDVLKILEKKYGKGIEFKGKLGNGPAKYLSFEGFKGYIGFIEALNDKFCHKCNRIRLSATGFLKLCLHYDYGVNIKNLIDESDIDELALKLEEIIYNKPKAHRFGDEQAHTECKTMNQIGG